MNSYNDKISLIDVQVASNGTETEVTTDVRVATRSVGYNEFYSASQSGYSPEIKFVMADYRDYNLQAFCTYNGKRYKIIRTYRTGGRTLELTCERVNTIGTI